MHQALDQGPALLRQARGNCDAPRSPWGLLHSFRRGARRLEVCVGEVDAGYPRAPGRSCFLRWQACCLRLLISLLLSLFFTLPSLLSLSLSSALRRGAAPLLLLWPSKMTVFFLFSLIPMASDHCVHLVCGMSARWSFLTTALRSSM